MLFGKKAVKEEEKSRKLSVIPEIVQKYLAAQWKLPPDLVPLLKAVIRNSDNRESAFEIRIFDESEAQAKHIQVNDYGTLSEHSSLVLYEGWFSESSKQVELQEKNKVDWDTPIHTEAQIQQKIQALAVPGSTVFFYLARGGSHGGPLGMGAAVIELNPEYPGKKQRKYNLYLADVVDMQPVNNGKKLFDSDKSKELARWIKEAHHKRIY